MSYKYAVTQSLKKTEECMEIDEETNRPKNILEKEQLEEDTCPVCFESFGDTNYIVTKCNHKFCNTCLFKSLSHNSCCPMCRQEIFKFKDKVKDLTHDDVNSLETDLDDFKNQVSFKLIYEIKKSIIQIVEENNIVSDEMKNSIKNFLNNTEINKKLNSSFYNLIKKVFSIISITSYENLHNWLKNKN